MLGRKIEREMIYARNWGHHRRQPRQQQRRADGAERTVHLSREQGERCCERGTHSRVTRQGDRCHRPVSDDDVREGRGEDKVSSRSEWDRSEHGHDPGHAAMRREGKPEKRERHEHTTYLSHQETELRWWFSAMFLFIPTVLPLVVKSRGQFFFSGGGPARQIWETSPIPIRHRT